MVLSALVLKAPRVFHIGEWWIRLKAKHFRLLTFSLLSLLFSVVHHRKANCTSDTTTLRKAEASFDAARLASALFPSELKVKNGLHTRITRLKKGNRDWGDPCDKELCLSLTRSQGPSVFTWNCLLFNCRVGKENVTLTVEKILDQRIYLESSEISGFLRRILRQDSR